MQSLRAPLKNRNIMKQILFTLITFFGLTISNQTFGQTQLEMNQEEQSKYLKADKELNLVYNKILKDYKSDTEFIKNFKNAQRIWIQFRDAEMKSKYPDREEGYYGSIHSMCWSIYFTELTEERTKKLKMWLTGIEEGDLCSGSIRTK
jgi:uncharacterized protein YecT (DUF1311 family)